METHRNRELERVSAPTQLFLSPALILPAPNIQRACGAVRIGLDCSSSRVSIQSNARCLLLSQ